MSSSSWSWSLGRSSVDMGRPYRDVEPSARSCVVAFQMRGRAIMGIAIMLALASRTTRAEPPRPIDVPPPTGTLAVIETGPWIGFVSLADYHGVGFGGRFAAGAARGRFTLTGEIAAARLSLDRDHE